MIDLLQSDKAINVISVKLFGNLVEVTGENVLHLNNVADTDSLLAVIKKNYPGLEKSSFAVAINKQLIKGNHPINLEDEIALLPPFSGG